MDRGGCPAHELARSVVIRLLSIADASSWSSLPLGRSLSAKTPSPGRQAVAAPRTVAASVFPGRAYACLESGWGCCSAVLLPNDVASLRAVASLPVAGFSFPYLFFLLFLIFFSIFSPSGDQRLMSSIPGFDVARLPPSSHQRANGLALAADSVRGLPTRPTKHCKPALEPRRLPALV